MFKRITFIALAALGLAACAKQELNVETRVPEKLTASMEEFTSKTKVQLNQEMKTVWTEGDKLTVFYKNEQNDCWQFDGETGDRNGTFSRVSDEEIVAPTLKDAFIVYPYAEGTTFEPEKNRITIEIPSVQTYTEGSYALGSNIMFAKTQSERFTMKNLTGYVMFQLKGDQKVKSIKLTGKQQENVSGAAYISTENELIDYIDDMNNTDEVETRAGSDTSKELVLDCGEGVQLDKNTATTFYLALVPRVFQEGFEIEIECTDGFTLAKSTKGSFAIRRNTVYKMKEFDINSNAEDVPLTPNVDFIDIAGLGGESANSYIITGEGYYQFPAVMGNDITKTVNNVAKVEVLWESFGTDETTYKRDLITALHYDSDDNYIYFETTDKKGNALIAAKDANGEILWSWHIWMTDKPKDQEYKNGAGEMMDRNLGATSARPEDKEKTFGLLYQWGRKDPFMGRTIQDNAAASTLSDWGSAQLNEETGTINYSILHPTTFILSTTVWLSGENTDLWASEKTIYDPCPAGYRVPDGGETCIWSRALNKTAEYSNPGLYDSTNEGYLFLSTGDIPMSDENVWYPSSSFISGADGLYTLLDFTGGLWACDKYAFYLRLSSDGQEFVDPGTPYYPSFGYAIRCYKEGSAVDPTPKDLSKVDETTSETANSYIVETKGFYKFPMMKGNSTDPVVNVAKVEVLWESFGTTYSINKGDLVSGVRLEEDHIVFYATGKKGNALIAAKDSEGKILWSWHIWLTDKPEDHVYKNNAGTMMDRNLGATSAKPEDEIITFGLLYQWGRKDPLLGRHFKSTLGGEPPIVSVSVTEGSLKYSIEHPTTFITGGSDGNWILESVYLWDIVKSVYDPCPPGYYVPNGGNPGIWDIALNQSGKFNTTGLYNQNHGGYIFSRDSEHALSASADVWYPFALEIEYSTGETTYGYDQRGAIWGCNRNDEGILQKAFFFSYNSRNEEVDTAYEEPKQATGLPVRCSKYNEE